jgi:phage terminase small subunit
MPKDKLSEKEKQFSEHYITSLNATKAAMAAGYSEKTAHVQGCQVLGRPRVQSYITKKMLERSKRTEITADYVLNGIVQTIETCIKTGEHALVLKGFELLGKHLKLFTDVSEHKFTVTQMGQVLINDPNAIDQDGQPAQKALTFEVGSEPNDMESA